jgi:hypothetical protein
VALPRDANRPEREYFIIQNNDDDNDDNTMLIFIDDLSWRYAKVLRDTE